MLKVWNQNTFQVKAILSGTRQRNKREGAGRSSSYSLHGFFTDPKTMFTHKNEYLLFPLLPGFAAGGSCHCYYSWHCLPEVEWSWCNSHSWHCCPRRAKKCHENRPMFGFVFLKQDPRRVYPSLSSSFKGWPKSLQKCKYCKMDGIVPFPCIKWEVLPLSTEKWLFQAFPLTGKWNGLNEPQEAYIITTDMLK